MFPITSSFSTFCSHFCVQHGFGQFCSEEMALSKRGGWGGEGNRERKSLSLCALRSAEKETFSIASFFFLWTHLVAANCRGKALSPLPLSISAFINQLQPDPETHTIAANCKLLWWFSLPLVRLFGFQIGQGTWLTCTYYMCDAWFSVMRRHEAPWISRYDLSSRLICSESPSTRNCNTKLRK